MVAELLPGAARVLDGGAFIGTFSLGLALNDHRLAFVCAVEANYSVTPILEHNFAHHLSVPYVVTPSVLTSSTSTALTGRYDAGNLGGLSFAANVSGDNILYATDGVKLHNIWKVHGPFDLIKLDIEGLERDVLDEARPLLDAEPNVAIWAECNDTPRSLDLAESLLSLRGRSVYYATWPADDPEALSEENPPIFPYVREAALLAGPRVANLSDCLLDAGCQLIQVHDREDLRQAMWLTPRWAPRQWWGKKPTALVAQAAHDVRGDNYDTYLGPGTSHKPPILEQLQRDLRLSEALAEQQLSELNALRDHVTRLSAALHVAELAAVERLADAEVYKERADRSDRALAAIRAAQVRGRSDQDT